MDRPLATDGHNDGPLMQSLISQQTELFGETVLENEQLHGRVQELEREVAVWKQGYINAENQTNLLQKEVVHLRQMTESLKEDNPLILALVDGDGNIFSEELLRQGQAGGRNAAMMLTKGLTDYTAAVDARISARSRVWLTVYCNKQGLSDTLVANDVCTSEQFEAFFLGFNQAAPLFSIIDVGTGKEAADTKIKEHLRLFTRFPQTFLIYFGGAHDNGYTSTLTSLQNEGLLGKIVLLRGYKELAVELKHLQLPVVEVGGVFRSTKLPGHVRHGSQKPVGYVSAPESKTNGAKATGPPKYLNPNLIVTFLSVDKPPPCTFYYLGTCRHGPKCTFGHDYTLTQKNLIEMRENSKKFPCAILNKGKVCPSGDDCISGHFCPRGNTCSLFKEGKCKFVGKNMHSKPKSSKPSAPSSVVDPADDTLSQNGIGTMSDIDYSSSGSSHPHDS
ncbi:uncharacterized protein EV420DRAFT_1512997 [Desarmillaria tabescens]|uniref:C3H1-type domain-containing protein n=1 Tax=Armillaria tabescens TaxID=1929756 RepID=A0AA39TNJ5_ARMTA|nr:uncharacterized protein EV420DRAFT_1512997 [Desarmillaria tabescens]KAK0465147.1 hypothetical protein EV420DRAFT_1512997 [Desarmillaria tabescens]